MQHYLSKILLAHWSMTIVYININHSL